MTEQEGKGSPDETEQEENPEVSDKGNDDTNTEEELKKSLEEANKSFEAANNKYIRLYADFENFKKITAKNKEDLLRYANEGIMSDTLTVIDHLELALQHTSDDNASKSLAEGVKLTLKELKNVLEKHGLITIDALNKPFDPTVHHAISQIETEDVAENTVVSEMRKGYKLRDRVLRAAMVGVSIKKAGTDKSDTVSSGNKTATNEKT